MKTKKIIALALSLAMVLGISACGDTEATEVVSEVVETVAEADASVAETEAVEETVVETEETVEETEVEVIREEVPYSIDGLSAQEIFDTVVGFADVSEDATYSTFADRFAVLPIEVPEDYPDSIAGGFRTWQFAYESVDGEELGDTIDNVSILDTDAVDEESDTIVGGRFASILYIADEATANEVFNLFNDYLAGSCGDAEETSYDGGQRFDYADGCYASIDYNEDISYYKINVAIDINV